jgi:putative peptidoglycan lipid II flippase
VAGLALPQLPYLIFICMIALMAGMLNGRGHFAVPAAAPVLLNCCLIATVLIFEDVWFLPWAVLLTGLLQCIVHIIALVRTGGMPRPGLKGSEQLNDLNKAFAPTLFASSIYQLNTLADSLIAYLLLADAPGAVTVLYFANRLLQFPLALIGHGIGTAIYPDLAQAGERGWEAVGDTLRRASGLLVGLLLPAGVGLALVADPLVRTIYQTGAFDAQAAERVVVVTGIYACQVLPVALSKLVLRGFHAGLDQRTPFIIGLITVGSNLALNLWLVQTPLEEAGLAVASLLSSLIAVFVSMVALARRGGGAAFSARGTIHPLLATVVMGLAVWAFLQAWPVAGAASGGAHAIRLLLAVGVGLATFAAVMGPGLKTLLRSTRG